jgi:hypothetical protein
LRGRGPQKNDSWSGTVPQNNVSWCGTVPQNNVSWSGTVPQNNASWSSTTTQTSGQFGGPGYGQNRPQYGTTALNQLENMTGMDLNGDGHIGNSGQPRR